MALLIDGYNLMYAAGIVGKGFGPGGLERSRQALLNFVAASVPERELAKTTVVFDAQHAPPGLPKAMQHGPIRVRFAPRHEEADALIERLIAADSAPRQLTVVSSDHRLQRAARRRRAKAIDSDLWFEEMLRARSRRNESTQRKTNVKPRAPLSAEQVEFWLDEFGLEPGPADTSTPRPDDDPFPPGFADREL